MSDNKIIFKATTAGFYKFDNGKVSLTAKAADGCQECFNLAQELLKEKEAYEKLKVQLERAEAIVKAYADAVKDQTVNVSIPYDDLDPDDFDIIEEFESGEPNDFGEKAREYFKEKGSI